MKISMTVCILCVNKPENKLIDTKKQVFWVRYRHAIPISWTNVTISVVFDFVRKQALDF